MAWAFSRVIVTHRLRPRKPEGSLGREAQDGHLDSHTAPELLVYRVPSRSRSSFSLNPQCGPSAQVLTLQIIRAIKFPPNQKRERTTGNKRLKGHGPGHTRCTRLHIDKCCLSTCITLSLYAYKCCLSTYISLLLYINKCRRNLAPKHARKHETHPPRIKKKRKKRVPSRFKRLWFYFRWCKLCWRL